LGVAAIIGQFCHACLSFLLPHFSVARRSYPVNAGSISRMDTGKRKNCQKKSVTVNKDHPSELIKFHAVKTDNI